MSFILPVPADQRPRRFGQLYPGLALYGFSTALLVNAHLGLSPWDVFHQGLSKKLGISIGIMTIIVSAAVLLLWIPLRQRVGVGTISNGILIGVSVDVSLHFLPVAHGMPARVSFLLAGVLGNGLATGLYIGAGLGPGPRDGLMTGIAARGHSIRLVRTSLELAVLALGWFLGGSIGAGTVLYALSIGPLVHILLPRLMVGRAESIGSAEPHGT